MNRRSRIALVTAIGALTLALRLPNVTAAYPYMGYVDEGNYLWHARSMYGNGGWDPGTYMYPSLPLYIACAASGVADGIRMAVGLPTIRGASKPALPADYEPFHPPEFLLAARVACLLASLAVVAISGCLAARWRGAAAGATASLAAALLPALVARSGIAVVDIWSTLFVSASLLVADFMFDRPKSRYGLALMAGVLVALAATSKYPAVLVALSPGLAILTDPSERERRVSAFAFVSGGVLGACVAMPALLLRLPQVIAAMRQQAALYSSWPWRHGYLHQAVTRMEEDLPFEGPELGWVVVLAAGLGVIVALGALRPRVRVLGPLAFAAALVGLHLRFQYQPFRNLLPITPLVIVFAGVGLVQLARLTRRGRWVHPACATGLLVVYLPLSLAIARYQRDLTDSRELIVDWLVQRSTAQDRVLVLRELRLLESELRRVPGRVRLADREAFEALAATGRYRFLLAGDLSAFHADVRGPLHLQRPPYRLRASFGSDPLKPLGWWWLGNETRVEVFERQGERQRRRRPRALSGESPRGGRNGSAREAGTPARAR